MNRRKVADAALLVQNSPDMRWRVLSAGGGVDTSWIRNLIWNGTRL